MVVDQGGGFTCYLPKVCWVVVDVVLVVLFSTLGFGFLLAGCLFVCLLLLLLLFFCFFFFLVVGFLGEGSFFLFMSPSTLSSVTPLFSSLSSIPSSV